MPAMTDREVWLRGPVAAIAPVLQPVAHALIAAREDVEALAPSTPIDRLWVSRGGAASAGYHVLHMTGALDRLFTYARGEPLNDVQKAELKFESQSHPEMDGRVLSGLLAAGVEAALSQLRDTDPAGVFEARAVGRAGLPSTVLGLLFHAAEHTTRHTGQFITTIKILGG
jgi:uncharacterized damage-inducible protein DinB